MNLIRLAVLGFLLAGCGFHPGSSSGDDAPPILDAPSGSGSDGGTTVDGPCGLPGAIRDDFNDDVTAAQWIVETPAQTSETGGELVVTPIGVVATVTITPMIVAQFMGYYSKHAVDLTGGTVTTEVTGMVDTSSPTAYAEFGVVNNRGNFALIVESHGTISFDSDDGQPMGTLSGSIPYDPVAHRWWRLAHIGTTITAEVSPDGTTWTMLGTPLAQPTWLTRVHIVLGGASSDINPNGSVHFDNLNQDLTPVGWCHSHSLSDQFERSSIGLDWDPLFTKPTAMPAPCTPMVNNGAFFNQSGMQTGRCELITTQGFDLTGDSVMVYVPPITISKPGWNPFLRVVPDAPHAAYLQFEQNATNQLCAQVDSAPEICAAYDANTDLYWRIHETGAALTFETSFDGLTWTTIATVPITFAVTALDVEFGTAVTQTFTGGALNLDMLAYNTTPPL